MEKNMGYLPSRQAAALQKDQGGSYPRNPAPRSGQYHTAPQGLKQSPQGEQMITVPVSSIQDQAAFALIEQVVMQGDLSKLNPEQRVLYYKKVCDSAGLNPFTRPFDYITLNGKLTLYAKKDATDQLRKVNGISIDKLEDRIVDDLYIVKAFARTKDGRTDAATGAVTIGHLKGEAKANAIMKAETKAKRRVTLSISGMGLVDESETESIPGAKTIDVDMSTGEIKQTYAPSIAPIQEIKQVAQQTKEDQKLSGKLLSKDQVDELLSLLDNCEGTYRASVYNYLKDAYECTQLLGAPEELYEKIKRAATIKAREYQDRMVNLALREEMVNA
jgi:hypothetical protein